MRTLVVFVLLWTVIFLHGAADTNVALKGITTQSLLYHNDLRGGASKAIDGNRNDVYIQGSCTHTELDSKPWWRVDLLDVYEVSSVTITNRGDCCGERIRGAEIRIGNSLEDNGNENPRCAVISSIQAGGSRTFQCHGMKGRYVNVVLPRPDYLTLCEVEVNASPVTEENVALNGKATQSSQYDSMGSADKAIDGNTNAIYGTGSCTHTQLESEPWWRLDLLDVYRVATVTITNRGDCCLERIDGAEIRIGNSLEDNGNENPRCAVISSIQAGGSRTFQCHGVKGLYVNVVLPRPDYLTLCEVEVNASPDIDWPVPDSHSSTNHKTYQNIF